MNKKIDVAVAGFGTACFMLPAYIAYITWVEGIRFVADVRVLWIGTFVLWGIVGGVALKNLLNAHHPRSSIEEYVNGVALGMAMGAMVGLVTWVVV